MKTTTLERTKIQPKIDGQSSGTLADLGPAPTAVRPDSAQPVNSGLTIEHLLYGLLVLIAMGMRLLALGSAQPLLSLEATQALPAFIDATMVDFDTDFLPSTPLLYTGQRFVFWLTNGGSDAIARVLPALVGTVFVIAPWLYRPQLGRIGALLLALLLALDPWILTFSRLSDGTVIALCLAFVFIGLMINRFRAELIAGIGALYLLSGPVAWLLLPVVILTFALFPPALPTDRQGRSRLVLVFGGVLLAAGTGLMAHWGSLSQVGVSLGVALESIFLSPTGDEYPVVWPFLRLFVDTPLAALIGGGALVWQLFSLKRVGNARRSLTWLLTAWTGWGLLLLLLPGRDPYDLTILILPLLIATADLGRHFLTHPGFQPRRPEVWVIILSYIALLVTSYFWMANFSQDSAQVDATLQIVAFYLLMPLLGVFFTWWSGRSVAGTAFGLLIGMSFLLATVSSGIHLALSQDLNPTTGLFATQPDRDLRLLSADVKRLSLIRRGDETVEPVLVQLPLSEQAQIGWYLRHMNDLRWGGRADPEVGIILTREGLAGSRVPADFIGTRYRVRTRWLPTDNLDGSRLLRWAILRERTQPSDFDTVELWAPRERRGVR